MSFQELTSVIGTVTAATKQSGDEVGNFIKTVLPRLVGEPAKAAMDSIDVSLTDKNGNIRNIIELYTEIAYKIKDISEVERIAVVEGLAGKYHITRMNALLDDLSRGESLYRQMYETATNSAGSAMRENEIYMGSLQARINQVKVEFEKLSVAIGEAFLTDAMIDFMKGASALLQLFTGMSNTVGVFGTVLSVIGSSLVLVSRRFREFSTGVVDYVKDIITARRESKKLEEATKATGDAADAAEAQVDKLGKTWKKTLATAGLVAVAFYAFGKVTEWLVGKLGEAREKAEEVASANKQLMESYENGAKEIDNLVDKYSALSAEMENTTDPNSAMLAEYYDLQNQIGELMPSLVTGETEYGDKLVGSAEALKIKIGLLREQLEIEKEEAALKAKEDRNEKIEVYKKELTNAYGDVGGIYNQFADVMGGIGFSSPVAQEFVIQFRDEDGNPIYDSPEKLAKLLDELKQKSASFADSNPQVAAYYDGLIDKMELLMSSNNSLFNDSDNVIRKNTSLLKSEYIPMIEEVIDANNGLTEANKEVASTFSAQLINASTLDNLDDLKNSLTSIASKSSAWQVFDKVDNIFGKLNDATADNFTALAYEAEDRIEALGQELLGLGINSDAVEPFIAALKERLNALIAEQRIYDKSMKQGNKTLAETLPSILAATEGHGDMAEGMAGVNEAYKEFKDVAEELAGITQVQIDDTDNLLLKYEMLSNQLAGLTDQELEYLRVKKDLTAEEEYLKQVLEERDFVMNKLGEIYPHLIDNEDQLISSIYEKISAVQEEQKANKTLLTAYKLAMDGKLTAEEKMTLATAMATKERIGYYDEEVKKLNDLYNEIIEASGGIEDFVTRNAKAQIQAQRDAYLKERDASASNYSSELDAVDAIIDAKEKSNESTKKSIYVANEYEQALEKINYRIKEQLSLQEKFPEHSETYRKSLEAQIKLEKEKLELQRKQAAELESQIASGNIKQTGNISSSSETKEANLSGWKGVKTQGYGNGHRGIDIDGYMGERLDTNIGGTVRASGKASSQGYHSSYGNIVVIEDSNGLKHFYAHLEKTLVKVGDTIAAGTQIGTIGNSGTTESNGGDGSHLHYEIQLNGATIDPSSYINDAKNNLVNYTTEVSSAVSDTQEAIDKAKSELIGLNGDILDQENSIAQLEVSLVRSYLASYEDKKSNYDQAIENSNNRLKKAESTSESYRAEIEKQMQMLKTKKSINQAEMQYLNDVIKNGGLSAKAMDELNDELHELGKLNSEIDFAIEDLQINKLQSILGYYEKLRKVQDNTIDLENIRLQEIDTNSKFYLITLEKITKAMKQKQIVNKDELANLNSLIASGQFHGEVLEQMIERYQALTQEIRNLNLEIQETDYEVVINVKTQYDEKIDDVQYQIDRLEAMKSMYDEGSGDYNLVVKEQIRLQDELTALYKEEYEAIQQKMRVQNLNINQIKDLEEALEDVSIAYWNSMAASKRMTKELAELEKKQKEEIANKLIEAYKSYIQQRRDEHMRALDAEMSAEQRRHNAVMKNYERELEAFRRSTEDKLRMLDEEEAEHDYDKEIDELTKDRDEVVRKLNLWSNDDSLRAKEERKKLEEELDEIDEEIKEKRYKRDLELRRNDLDKKLEEKEREVQDFMDAEDQKYDEFTYNLEQQRRAWEDHYDNLLNDERKFAEIREQIMNDNFEAIKEEFQEYIDEMSATMPELEASMDGTMRSVGNSIRRNIIDALQEAIELMSNFETSRVPTNLLPDGSGNITGGNSTGGTSSGGGSSSSKSLNNGDKKVILGKFMTEELAELEPSKSRQAIIRDKAHVLAAEGRAENSNIKSNEGLQSVLSGLSKSELTSLASYVNSAATSVVISDYLQEHIKDFAERLLTSAASLSTGGMIPSGVGGIDGQGGRAVIVHPNEIINNPLDAKRLLSMANVLEKATAFISPIISKLPMITKTLAGDTEQYVINFGDVNNATQQEAQNFAKEILNTIRVKKGGK